MTSRLFEESYTNPIAITFSAMEAKLLHYAVGDLAVRADLGIRPPLSGGFDAVHAKLVSFLRETKTSASQPHPPPSAMGELIDTSAAAVLLHCSPQWVRRIRAHLDGHNVGGRWLFSRQAVVEYAERKAGQRT
ncbi:helix-turn-helix domain-containing protein [Mycobacterium sp. E2462]|uniref:helix-turn-helix domain-containing protein n=1 Tax=Mycobacterium sp. E2462 TaxID=1834133 RepID=UPI000B0DBA6B|nr:helix-turn-helix domain-containing protein [Mycobacterium sp. E2462]